MKKWPVGEIRRIERAYSPKREYFGFYMLGSFIKNVPNEIEAIMATHDEPIVLVQRAPGGIFKVVGSYYYENIPKQYQDERGQYPLPNKDYSNPGWEQDCGMVTGFPLRPWIRIPVPCTAAEYQGKRSAEREKMWALGKCESPIETKFLEESHARGIQLRPQFWIQAPIGNYRVDFACVPEKIAIEVDGHEYHSTKEQRTYDAQRSRALQMLGWKVIRFTGTEIYSNAGGCIDDLIKLLPTNAIGRKSIFDF